MTLSFLLLPLCAWATLAFIGARATENASILLALVVERHPGVLMVRRHIFRRRWQRPLAWLVGSIFGDMVRGSLFTGAWLWLAISATDDQWLLRFFTAQTARGLMLVEYEILGDEREIVQALEAWTDLGWTDPE